MDGEERSPDALTLGAFAAAMTLGGANFLAVRFSNRELPPFWGAGLRFTAAAVLFVVMAVVLRLQWPRGHRLTLTVLYGALNFAVSYALMYWALLRVTAGLAAIVMAIVPLMTQLLAAAQGLERLRLRGVMGALLALTGIGWMAIGPRQVVLPISALAAMIAAALAIGQSIILGKRLSANHPVMTNAVGMTAGGLLLLALSAIAGESWVWPRQAAAVGAVIYLVTLGSVGLFILVLLVVRRWTASATSYMFVLIPVVTLLLGALVADEAVTAQAVVGAVLVVLGVWFGALSPAARHAAAARGAAVGPPGRSRSPSVASMVTRPTGHDVPAGAEGGAAAGTGDPSPPPPEPSHAERCRTLVTGGTRGTLCTLAADPEGYPYGSVASYALDESGNPLFFVSLMAEHTQNALRDPRASLLVAEPVPEGADPLASGRATLLGLLSPVAEDDLAGARARYLEANPTSAYYIDFGDFAFYRLDVNSIRYVGGYGRMSWVDPAAYASADPDPLAPSAVAVIGHMNADHLEAQLLMCRHLGRRLDATEASMSAVDRYGFEMIAATPSGRVTVRLGFPQVCATANDVRQAMVALVTEARVMATAMADDGSSS